ncbi:hypothetical protein [Aminobacter niigataensis]|uniref:hypothetical protein n=1 Tax=Aminobacter niigataensis TaxID=83265 RepID=UPI0024C9D4EF|nr:hypothetical protein [Aminobacter niigataensis]CAI2932366.1 conserved exported protein of unknown function [Aminobacter niigataensis]
MRLPLAFIGTASLALAATIALATPAVSGGWDHDRVYADSFGNLVVDSAAGYKRIVVGQGHSARKLAEYTRSATPKVVYLDEGQRATRHCYRPPMLLKGRSYMYGFSEGEIPQPGLRCY